MNTTKINAPSASYILPNYSNIKDDLHKIVHLEVLEDDDSDCEETYVNTCYVNSEYDYSKTLNKLLIDKYCEEHSSNDLVPFVKRGPEFDIKKGFCLIFDDRNIPWKKTQDYVRMKFIQVLRDSRLYDFYNPDLLDSLIFYRTDYADNGRLNFVFNIVLWFCEIERSNPLSWKLRTNQKFKEFLFATVDHLIPGTVDYIPYILLQCSETRSSFVLNLIPNFSTSDFCGPLVLRAYVHYYGYYKYMVSWIHNCFTRWFIYYCDFNLARASTYSYLIIGMYRFTFDTQEDRDEAMYRLSQLVSMFALYAYTYKQAPELVNRVLDFLFTYVQEFNRFSVCRYKSHLYTPIYVHIFSDITTSVIWNGLLGAVQFVLSGGESNPGPVFSKFKENISSYYTGFFSAVEKVQTTLSSFKDMGELIVHLIRLFTSVSDFIYSTLYSRYASPLDFSFRLVTLIKNTYDIYTTFLSDPRFTSNRRPRHTVAQGGAVEAITLGMMMSFLPPKIKAIFKDLPTFTSAKVLDDLDWIYALTGSLIALPRRIMEALNTDVVKNILDPVIKFLYKVENLFPFSKLHHFLQKLEDHENLVKANRRLMVSQEFFIKTQQLEEESQALQRECKQCRRDLPGYSQDSFQRFTRLFRKMKSNSEQTRPEPACFIMNGPPGSGKSTLLNALKRSYTRAGHTSYAFAQIDGESKLFFDSYDQSDLFILDDMGATGDKLWGMLINMVSTVQLPLPAADAKLKDTIFFTSKLILGTTNLIPNSFPPDVIKEKYALYRRIHQINFRHCTFQNGVYNGFITFETWSDKSNQWISYAKVEAEDGHLDLENIDSLIRQKIEKNNENYHRNIDGNNYVPKPLPDFRNPKAQGYSNAINSFIDMVVKKTPTAEFIISNAFEYAAELLDAISLHIPEINLSHTIGLLLSVICVGFGVVTAYRYITQDSHEEEEQPLDRRKHLKNIHYSANKIPKKNIHKIVAQGRNVDLNVPPQLTRFGSNMVRIDIQYISKNGLDQNVRQNALISNLNILTVFHTTVDRDSTKPTFVKVYSKNNNILYESVPITMKTMSIEGDWIIFEMPKTTVQLFKKIKITDPTSTELYLAMDSNIIDLKSRVTDMNTRLFYSHKTYGSHLEKGDLLYDIEGDGMCGALVVTKDGGLIAMHVAAVEADEINDPWYGVARIFSQSDIKNIMNVFDSQDGFIQPVKPEKSVFIGGINKEDKTIEIHISNDDDDEFFDAMDDDKILNTTDFPVYVTKDNNNCEQLIPQNKFSTITTPVIDKFMNLQDLLEHKNTVSNIASHSGVYVENLTGLSSYTPDATVYIPSPIFGIFPTQRKPAFEAPPEQHKKSFHAKQLMVPAGNVNLVTTEYAMSIIECVLGETISSPFDMFQIIHGDNTLNHIDPNTSTGFAIPLTKRDCIDYENNVLTSIYHNDFLKPFINSFHKPSYTYQNCAMLMLKDELKDITDLNDVTTKPKKIRSFTACDLHQTVLLRYFFGSLISRVMKDRMKNGIMIGINPLSSEWESMIERLHFVSKNKIFDGDYAFYDKKMQPILQHRLNDILISLVNIDADHFNTTFDVNLTKDEIYTTLCKLLEWMINTPIISEQKIFIKTHGMPSGSPLTAFYNSLINVIYIAYVYKTIKPDASIPSFFSNLSPCVYGDDLIISVSDEASTFFTPSNFAAVMQSIGLDFTPAEKGLSWKDIPPFKKIEECTFLKRSFKMHPLLNRFVAPLSLVTIRSTLSYVKDPLNQYQLTLDKLYNFQRELFLHWDIYEDDLSHVINFIKDNDISIQFIPMTKKQLIELYNRGEYAELLVIS